jgi:hypothetical protein
MGVWDEIIAGLAPVFLSFGLLPRVAIRTAMRAANIKKILKHLGLWDLKARPPPKATRPQKAPEYSIDYSDSQLPASDEWLYVDPHYPELYPP